VPINRVYKACARRKRGIGRLVLAFLAVLTPIAPLANFKTYGKLAHPPLGPGRPPEVRQTATQGAPLRVMFMGVTTILLEDGETAIMTDGFFSRPGRKTLLLRKLKPDQKRITHALSEAGVTKLAAVMTAHSHYDHAMDAPEVARRTGALLVGSESTRSIARGVNFPEDRFRVIGGGETLTFGRFRVTVIKSRHSPGDLLTRHFLKGEIKSPLRTPARMWDYKEGGNYSFLIEHCDRRILIHPSANYIPGLLRAVRADVIFLGIGGLGRQSPKFAEEYWREVVRATRARVVIPIHWDDFTKPLDKPLRRSPRPFDNVKGAMKTIGRLAEDDHVTVRTLSVFEPVDVSELSR
jgi:L-ascorbate metabolism protein UlaG (beta-lactamase superfamily)